MNSDQEVRVFESFVDLEHFYTMMSVMVDTCFKLSSGMLEVVVNQPTKIL